MCRSVAPSFARPPVEITCQVCFELRKARTKYLGQADLFVCFSGPGALEAQEGGEGEARRQEGRCEGGCQGGEGDGARSEHDRQGERPRCDSRLAPQGEGEDGGGARLLVIGPGGRSNR